MTWLASALYQTPWAFLYAAVIGGVWLILTLVEGGPLTNAAVAAIVAYFGYTLGWRDRRAP